LIKKKIVSFFFIFVISVLPTFSSYKDILNRFEKAKTISFNFTQTYISGDKTESLTENGSVFYKNGCWRWDYLGVDKRSYIILEDEIYEQSEDGVEKLNLTKDQFNQSIVNILKRPNDFINSHRKQNTGASILIFGNKEDAFSNIKICFKKGDIDKIIIISRNSDILTIGLSNIKFNIKIDDSLFHIKK